MIEIETRDTNADFDVAGVKSEVAERAARLKTAVKAAGGNQAVAQRASMNLGTLNNYIAGRDMKAASMVALAKACNVSLDWLATGREPPQTPADRARAAVSVALDQMTGKPLPSQKTPEISGLGMEQAPLRAPHQLSLDAVALAKSIEIVEAMVVPNGGSITSLASARRIASIYLALTGPDEHLQPPPQLPSPAPEE
jgi:transcriptional regulator with XRE-family HTH domain